MSLRFALLGLLHDRPSSGYDLSQRFSAGIGAYAWDAQHSQIYPELKKLLADDLIQISEEGARGRKTYAITDHGRTELQDWLRNPPSRLGGVRNEYVLRLFLLPALGHEDAQHVLHATIEFATEQVNTLTAEYDQLTADQATASGGLAAQYGIHVYRATIDWAHWALNQITADPTFGSN